MSVRVVLGYGAIFVIYVLGFFLLLGGQWLKQNFEIVSFEQILFHLQFPLLDTDSSIARYFIRAVVIPSLLLALGCVLAPSFVRFLRAYKEARLGFALGATGGFVGFVLFVLAKEPSFGSFSVVLLAFAKRVLLPAVLASVVSVYGLRAYRACVARYGWRLSFGLVAQGGLACAVLMLAANVANNKFHITAYFAKGAQEWGSLYEQHYSLPILDSRLESSKAQNLIVILAESLESTFSNGGGGGTT
ncbi:hypothetical protein [Helicobacter canis]|uniref:Uncharacterized protein n=1 Tax=Helicobacter canis NCTC 12740 TaxID=1357399 RepID=V8CHE5_9HELI|nr:hypothetical protein [Helicobacter canis]ETD26789.1 hypothetical protein HMPREF2087_01179 [Helicobacter canis NCTC 12740]